MKHYAADRHCVWSAKYFNCIPIHAIKPPLNEILPYRFSISLYLSIPCDLLDIQFFIIQSCICIAIWIYHIHLGENCKTCERIYEYTELARLQNISNDIIHFQFVPAFLCNCKMFDMNFYCTALQCDVFANRLDVDVAVHYLIKTISHLKFIAVSWLF